MFRPLFFLLFSLTLHAELIDGVAILVKNEPITLSDIRNKLKENGQNLQKTMEVLIRKKLEAQEAEERQLSVSNQEVYAHIEKMAEQNQMTIRQFYDAMQSARGTTSTELKAKVKEKLLHEKL